MWVKLLCYDLVVIVVLRMGYVLVYCGGYVFVLLWCDIGWVGR